MSRGRSFGCPRGFPSRNIRIQRTKQFFLPKKHHPITCEHPPSTMIGARKLWGGAGERMLVGDLVVGLVLWDVGFVFKRG